MKAVVIFSGGQDSTTCLYWAQNRYDHVECITFNYGQKHSVELDCARQICIMEDIKQTIIDISFLDTIVESALTSDGDVNELNDKGLPSSFVPNRNQLFITLAHSYAQKVNADVLVTGVCQTDYSGYPDCRETFIRAIEWATNMGSKSDVKIETPLMYLTKAQTFLMALQEGCMARVINYSHTCYNGNRDKMHEWGFGCGKCPACELRKKGFEEFLNLDYEISVD
jgi:7-cyano-7-deazaguanine synthase